MYMNLVKNHEKILVFGENNQNVEQFLKILVKGYHPKIQNLLLSYTIAGKIFLLLLVRIPH